MTLTTVSTTVLLMWFTFYGFLSVKRRCVISCLCVLVYNVFCWHISASDNRRERLAVMDLEPLELRRIKTDLTMYFKIYNNLSALPFDYLPCDNSVRTYHSQRKCEYIIQPFCRTQLFENDFLIDVWVASMAYRNLLYHLKPLRNLSVDYLKLICHLF